MLSFSWTIIINFSSARKNNWHGTFIPSPSPAFVVFPVTVILQWWFLSDFKKQKTVVANFPDFSSGRWPITSPSFPLTATAYLSSLFVGSMKPCNSSLTIGISSHDRMSSNYTSTASIFFFFEKILLLPRELWENFESSEQENRTFPFRNSNLLK